MAPVGCEEIQEFGLEPAGGEEAGQLLVVAHQRQVGQVDPLRVRGVQVPVGEHNLQDNSKLHIMGRSVLAQLKRPIVLY